jgi:hypothetical protein
MITVGERTIVKIHSRICLLFDMLQPAGECANTQLINCMVMKIKSLILFIKTKALLLASTDKFVVIDILLTDGESAAVIPNA